MKKFLVAAAATLMGSAAFAADLPSKKEAVAAPVAVSPWDFTVGGSLTTNYMFRGISQSNNSFGVAALGELRYNINDMWQLYIGTSGESVKLSNIDPGPGMELDVDGGVRATVGHLTADLGVWGYLYPGSYAPSAPDLIFPTRIDWFEGYFKAGYDITDWLNVGGNVFVSPSYLNTGANSTYLSGTFKVTLPANFAVSGEFGHQFFGGLTDARHLNFAGLRFTPPEYNTWNIGASYTYKVATLDVRYWGTDLNKRNCALITGETGAIGSMRSTYCGQTVVATLSFALQAKDLK